jgi:hypothetical protein
MILYLLACGGGEEEEEETVGSYAMSGYHGLEEGAAWTYRDDGEDEDTGLPEEADLLRAHYVGDGEVEFRRGTRWADAATIGFMRWESEDGLTLTGWELPFGEGDGDFPIASAQPVDEPKVSRGRWKCEAEKIRDLWTWYGQFDLALQFTCKGGGGPKGTYSFAQEVGLVQLDMPDYGLDLVAPW